MKLTAKAVVVVLISMMTSVVTAQTTSSNMSKPVPAVLTAEEPAQYLNYLATHTLKEMNLEHALDSALLVELFKTNNQPIYTSVEKAGLVAGRKYAEGDSICVMIVRKDILKLSSYPIRSNEAEAKAAAAVDAKLKLAAARAHAVEELNEGRPRSGREIVAKLSNGEEVTIPTQMGDDFGWDIVGGGTFQAGAGINALSGAAGIQYTHHLDREGKWYAGGKLLGSLRQTYLNDNAVNAGDHYTTYGTEFGVLAGHTFGKHRQLRLAVEFGMSFEWYKTDSQARYYADGSWDEHQSWGNYNAPFGKFTLGYQGINWPVGVYVSLGIRQHDSVWQNEGSESKVLGTAEVGFTWPIFRNVTNNK